MSPMVSWPEEQHRRWLPHLLLFVVVLIWSGNTVISKIVIREMAPVELAVARFSLGVLAFHLPMFLVFRRIGPAPERYEWKRLLTMGVVGAGTSMLLFTLGLNLMPATYVSLVMMTGPALTALLAWVLF